MEPKFFGTQSRSLDEKHRIALPAKFRQHFDTTAFLNRHIDGCVAIWTPDRFDERLGEMQVLQAGTNAERLQARLFSSGTEEVEIDRQGRVAIAEHLRNFAGLSGQVTVTGFLDHIEVWDPATMEAKMQAAEADLAHPPDDTAGAPSLPVSQPVVREL